MVWRGFFIGVGVGVILFSMASWTWRNSAFLDREGGHRKNSAELRVATDELESANLQRFYRAALTAAGGQPSHHPHITAGQPHTQMMLKSANGQSSGTVAQKDQHKATLTAMDAKQASGSTNLPMRAMKEGLDQYGGSKQAKCTKSTGYFHLEKIKNHWWFCTPQGNVFWMVGVFDLGRDPHITDLGTSYDAIAKSKYGDLDMTWGPQQIRRIKSWGFNSIAEFSSGWTWPTATCSAPACTAQWINNGGKQPVPVPMTAQVLPSLYSLFNLYEYAPDAVKDTVYGVNRGYWKGYGSSFPDIFDQNFGLWLDGAMRKDTIITPAENSPWVIAWITDECDELNGLCGAGPDFPTKSPGHNQRSQGLVTLLTSPVQTAHPIGGLVRKVEEYSTATVFSKEQLRNYLREKYDGIAALNTAWGSQYTAFDTTGAQVTTETIGMGDGRTITFTAKLAHSDVSAYSVAVKVDGRKVGGDCPGWVDIPVCASVVKGSGQLIGPPAASYPVQAGTIRYEPGAIAITFAAAPPQGARISVDYIHDGWGYGTGLMDEDGRHGWIPTDPVRLGSVSYTHLTLPTICSV